MSKELEKILAAAGAAAAAAAAGDRLEGEHRLPLAQRRRAAPRAGCSRCATCTASSCPTCAASTGRSSASSRTRASSSTASPRTTCCSPARAAPASPRSSRGCSTSIAKQGLRLIEVEKNDLVDLPDIVDLVAERPERFLLFCDDLSFHGAEEGYKALKVALDGSISATSENLLIYATSNRRHLMPEYMEENLETKHVGEEIHPGETVEEKISLSERFGLWVSFYPFDQDEYLDIVEQWLRSFGAPASDRVAGKRRCSGRCSAARAAAAWRGSSRATGPAGTRRRSDHRGRRRGHRAPGRRVPARAAPRRQGLRGLLGISRRQDRAGRAGRAALARELHEELGIEVGERFPWITRVYIYPHGTVRLHFFRVHDWQGEPHPREDQAIAWQAAGRADRRRRCCPRTRRCSPRWRCRSNTQ